MLCSGHGDYLGRKAIAIIKPIRDQIADLFATHAAQGAQCQCGTGRAVGIEITHDQNLLLPDDGFFKQIQRTRQSTEFIR